MTIAHPHAAPEAQGKLPAIPELEFPQMPSVEPYEPLRERAVLTWSAKCVRTERMLYSADRQGSQGNNFYEDDFGRSTGIPVHEGFANFAVLANGKVLSGLQAPGLMSTLRSIAHQSDDRMGIRHGGSSCDAGFDESVHGGVLYFGNSYVGHNVLFCKRYLHA